MSLNGVVSRMSRLPAREADGSCGPSGAPRVSVTLGAGCSGYLFQSSDVTAPARQVPGRTGRVPLPVLKLRRG